MISVAGKYITRAVYLVRFKAVETNMRFKQAEAEKVFGTYMGIQSQQTNVPDGFDPNFPRITFKSNHKSLDISQASVQLMLSFDSSKAVPDQLAIIQRNMHDFHRMLVAFIGGPQVGETAVVLTVNYPCKLEARDISQHLGEQFYKQKMFGEMASYSFKVGFETKDHLFLNFATDAYQLRTTDIAPAMVQAGRVTVDLNAMKLVEEGIGVNVDVNDRPRHLASKDYVGEGPDPLLAVASSFIVNDLDSTIGVQIG